MKTRPVGQKMRIEQEKNEQNSPGLGQFPPAQVCYKVSLRFSFELNRYSSYPRRGLETLPTAGRHITRRLSPKKGDKLPFSTINDLL
ncbi:hypothetical protein C8N47_106193 [Mangrovibacterium marinum]|uniref:Uncharacterized protein n=1 Tax=Mangrovibacterium marinum TaxID=1639118 RepID=A0A2T5C2X0_9BACT|nr:hypothetical protein C8N47_106193 [Mangrovibacterium marinum]